MKTGKKKIGLWTEAYKKMFCESLDEDDKKAGLSQIKKAWDAAGEELKDVKTVDELKKKIADSKDDIKKAVDSIKDAKLKKQIEELSTTADTAMSSLHEGVAKNTALAALKLFAQLILCVVKLAGMGVVLSGFIVGLLAKGAVKAGKGLEKLADKKTAKLESDKLDEAEPMVTVDDKYIADVQKLLAQYQKTDPEQCQQALAKVMSFKGKQLVKPEKFIENRFGTMPDTTAVTQGRDDYMKSVVDKRRAELNDISRTSHQPHIATIWVKSLDIDDINDNRSVAKLEIEYVDGKKEDVDFSIGTTGASGGFENADRLYKELKKNMKMPKGIAVSDEDIRLSMLHIAFNDWRIKWLYGKNKATDSIWAFSREPQRLSTNPIVRKERKSWLDKNDKNSVIVYQSGNTTIYKTESIVDEDVNSSKKTFTSEEFREKAEEVDECAYKDQDDNVWRFDDTADIEVLKTIDMLRAASEMMKQNPSFKSKKRKTYTAKEIQDKADELDNQKYKNYKKGGIWFIDDENKDLGIVDIVYMLEQAADMKEDS